MERVGVLISGFGVSWTACALSFIGQPHLATLSLACCGLLRGASIRLAALLVGASAGLLLLPSALERWGTPLVGAIGLILLAAGILTNAVAARSRRSPSFQQVARLHLVGRIAIPLCAAAMTLAVITTSRLLRTVSGLDAAALCHRIWPLLAAGALGSFVAGYLTSRHPRWRPAALCLLGAVAIGLLARLLFTTHDVLAIAQRIQQPSVTRVHFVFGISLMAIIASGAPVLVLAATLRCAAAGMRNSRSVMAGIAVWLVAFVAVDRFEHPSHVPDDPVRLATGAPSDALTDAHTEAPRVAVHGRPVIGPSWPGWPLPDDPLAALAAFIDELAPAGPMLLLGPESASMNLGSHDPATENDALAAAVILPSAIAMPLPTLVRLSDRLRDMAARLARGGVLVTCADVAELEFQDLALLARVTEHALPGAMTLVAGDVCVFVAVRGTNTPGPLQERIAEIGRANGLIACLSPTATNRLAEEARDLRQERLLLRSARTRLAHRRPTLAADNLRQLLARSDLLNGIHPDRVRLAFAAAILADDFASEDRLLRLLNSLGVEDVRAWRRARRAAREQLLQFLTARRDADPYDADVRHRLGRALACGGHDAAGIDELTTASTYRPKLFAAYVDLAFALLRADELRYLKWFPPSRDPAKPNPTSSSQLVPGISRTVQRYRLNEPREIIRLDIALGLANLVLAEHAGDQAARDTALRVALGRFNRAMRADPFEARAHRELARTHHLLGNDGPALKHSRRAVSLDPLDPLAWALLSSLTQRSPTAEGREESRRATANALLTGFPLALPAH